MSVQPLNRRHAIVLAAALAASVPTLSLAQAKIKVAGIYTVPFEQQWAGRLHTALKAAEARGEPVFVNRRPGNAKERTHRGNSGSSRSGHA